MWCRRQHVFVNYESPYFPRGFVSFLCNFLSKLFGFFVNRHFRNSLSPRYDVFRRHSCEWFPFFSVFLRWKAQGLWAMTFSHDGWKIPVRRNFQISLEACFPSKTSLYSFSISAWRFHSLQVCHARVYNRSCLANVRLFLPLEIYKMMKLPLYFAWRRVWAHVFSKLAVHLIESSWRGLPSWDSNYNLTWDSWFNSNDFSASKPLNWFQVAMCF